MTNATATAPRIYVADLAAYNNGILRGVWIDATDADDMHEATAAMLRDSPVPNTLDSEGRPTAEEWAIHDYEGFEGVKLGEYDDFETVATLGALIEEHGEAFAAWYENESRTGMDAGELRERFEDEYRGEFESFEEFAAELYADVARELEQAEQKIYGRNTPDIMLTNRIDWEGVAHDLQQSGAYWTREAGYKSVHVFASY